jgi:hypothetical protein
MKNLGKVITIILSIIVSANLYGQQKTIPLCDKIEIVNANLEKKLNLFSEYENFQQALLYQENDTLFILEVK